MKSLGTPGRIWTFPFTTLIGTQRLSSTNRTWSSIPRVVSIGSLIMRFLASSAGEGTSYEKLGCDGCGLESFFILDRASSCSTSFKPKAVAIDWYVMSSCLVDHEQGDERRRYGMLTLDRFLHCIQLAVLFKISAFLLSPRNHKVIFITHAPCSFYYLTLIVSNDLDSL